MEKNKDIISALIVTVLMGLLLWYIIAVWTDQDKDELIYDSVKADSIIYVQQDSLKRQDSIFSKQIKKQHYRIKRLEDLRDGK